MNGKDLETLTEDYWRRITYIPNVTENKEEPWVYLKRKVIKSHELFPDHSDPSTFIECKICGFRAKEIARHLKDKHCIDPNDYGITKCSENREIISKRLKGKNNPAYNHGGKYSPFSPNFIHYKDGKAGYTKEDIQEKAKQTRKENPQNQNTKIEYYLNIGMNENEARAALSDRQATFSMEKCILRYGEQEGVKIWEERQRKWQNTLNSKSRDELYDINKRKSSYYWIPDDNIRGIFYIIKTPKGIKIGITKNSLNSRYGRYLKRCKVILTHEDTFKRCAMLEYIMKNCDELKTFRYDGNERFDGWTETFKCCESNVLNCYYNLKENFENVFKEKYPQHAIK